MVHYGEIKIYMKRDYQKYLGVRDEEQLRVVKYIVVLRELRIFCWVKHYSRQGMLEKSRNFLWVNLIWFC